MSFSGTQSIVSATSLKNILFFSTNPLTNISEYDIGSDLIQTFSWNSDNKRFCYSTSSEISSILNTDDFSNSLIFSKDNHHLISSFLKSKPDQIVTSGLSDFSFLYQIVEGDNKKNINNINNCHIIGLKAFKHPLFSQKPVLTLNKNDSTLAISGKTISDNILVVYDLIKMESNPNIYHIEINENVSFIEFCPFISSRLAMATNKGSLIIQDLKSLTPIFTLSNKQVIPICGINFSPQNMNEIFLGYSNNIIHIYDLSQRKTVSSISIESKLSCFTVFENGIDILVGTNLGKVYQYDIRNAEKPIDVIQLGKNQIDNIYIQNGDFKVTPDTKKPVSTTSQKSNRISLFSKNKRTAKESTIASSLSRANQSMKDIKNLFMSPAIKKPKQNDVSSDNSINFPPTINFDIKLEKSPATDLRTSNHNLRKTSEFQTNSDGQSLIDDGSNSKVVLDGVDFSFEDMMYEINREFRDIRFHIIKQNIDQTTELKNYICKTLEDSFSREQELITENNRLREEIIHYKNLIANTRSDNIQ